LGLRKKARAFLPLRRFKKCAKKGPQQTKITQQTTKYILKNGFSIAGKRLFGIIRGLGYNTIENWVGSFFTKLLTVQALSSARAPIRIKFFHKSPSSSAAAPRLRCLQLAKRHAASLCASDRAGPIKADRTGKPEVQFLKLLFRRPMRSIFLYEA
jgi:hypothetical protein